MLDLKRQNKNYNILLIVIIYRPKYVGLAKNVNLRGSQTKVVILLFLSGTPVQEVHSSFINKGLLRVVKQTSSVDSFSLPCHGGNAQASTKEQSAKECVVHQQV